MNKHIKTEPPIKRPPPNCPNCSGLRGWSGENTATCYLCGKSTTVTLNDTHAKVQEPFSFSTSIKKSDKAHEDNIGAMQGYSKWHGKTAVERELIEAIRISVRRSKEALGQTME